MNTKEDLERIKKHIPDLQSFTITPLIEWINRLANKLDEYKKQIEEKDAIIKRMIESEK